ncbi:hypothetical protein LJR069_001561 [Variovorax paradoxus]|uniref:hypothetical protein n=1 Tax=Variovorax paradoxus TaxID=34073 RepID=UPI003ECCA56C
MNKPSPKRRERSPDEPEITQEESVPTDGSDTEGEEQMKKVGNRKLQDPGDAERKTPPTSPEAVRGPRAAAAAQWRCLVPKKGDALQPGGRAS